MYVDRYKRAHLLWILPTLNVCVSLYRRHMLILSCPLLVLYIAHSSTNMRTMLVAVPMHVLRQPNLHMYFENATPVSVNRYACRCKLVCPYLYHARRMLTFYPKNPGNNQDSPCQQNLQTHFSLPHSPQGFAGTGFAQVCVGQVPPSGPKP